MGENVSVVLDERRCNSFHDIALTYCRPFVPSDL